MNRSKYFDYISEKLSALAVQIEMQGKLNVLNLHNHSENFYMHFLNMLFGWKLENVNNIKLNVEGIDLRDDHKERKIIVQVSATATKAKIESALSKDLSVYPGYCFKFISICKDAEKLRKGVYNNPHKLLFAPNTDVHDIKSLLAVIGSLKIDNQYAIYNFIKKELGIEADLTKMESNIAKVINILANEDLSAIAGEYQTKSFEIERKIDFNNLSSAKAIIQDYAVNHNHVDKIYQEFNKQGANVSHSVLASINKMYLKSMGSLSDDALFFSVIEHVIQRIQNSANYSQIPFEELEMCVNILVVDAFIRCKVFKNPEGYKYAFA